MLSNLPPTTDYYTGTVATPDGWTFVIPLQNRTSLGYLYNDTITTDEQAEKNFREQFGVEEVGKPRSFRNYLAKNPIIDDRVILNGNKLTFIEPLEATSVTTYDFFAEHTMTAIMKNGSNIPQELQNAVFRNAEMVYQNMNFILYHYQFGSKYDTPFWDYAKTLVPNDPKLYEWLRRGERFKWKEFMDENYSYYKVSSLYLMHHKLSGDDWELNTNLSGDDLNVEVANYSWSITETLKATFGSQAEPYGIAWGLHRPSNNWFVSTPRDHSVMDGVGVNATVGGVGVDFLYGGGLDDYWASRVSYELAGLGINSEIGLSVNSNEAQLLDVSVSSGIFETSLEYDLSEEADGAYWARGVVNPLGGLHILVGYNSNEEVLYGVGYKCNDNFHVSTEFSSEDEDGKDIVVRASYSF